MHRIYPYHLLTIFTVTLLFNSSPLHSSNELNLSRYEIKNLLSNKIDGLRKIAENPVIVNDIQRQNALNVPLAKIKQLDQQWINSPANTVFKQSLQNNKSGLLLKQLVAHDDKVYSEIFLTDNQGALVSAYPVTSDYWQGDEAKWINAWHHGEGNIFIGNIVFDESSQMNALQISVPVYALNETIGVLIAGIRLTFLQSKYLRSLSRPR